MHKMLCIINSRHQNFNSVIDIERIGSCISGFENSPIRTKLTYHLWSCRILKQQLFCRLKRLHLPTFQAILSGKCHLKYKKKVPNQLLALSFIFWCTYLIANNNINS